MSGAERLAAALTLGKSFTIRAPWAIGDAETAASAINPFKVLPEWTISEVNALLRCGLFAPGTYGRIRFHHRDSQEYLTARWLHRLIDEGSHRSEIDKLIFVERYGVETLVSSLALAASWLAVWHEWVRDKLIDRDPPVLIRHADPRSLPVAAKEKLIENYALLHERGDIANDSLSWESLAMFAIPELGPSIERAWWSNPRDRFRVDLLRLVREGRITSATHLAIAVVVDPGANQYLRIAAGEAIGECENPAGYDAILSVLRDQAAILPVRLASAFAEIVFPNLISVRQLFDIVRSTPRGKGVARGFEYSLETLWVACRSNAERELFLEEFSAICLQPPFVSEWERISRGHHELARNAVKIASEAVRTFGASWPPSLVSVLMIAERVKWNGSHGEEEEKALGTLVNELQDLKRALFWADVADCRHDEQQRSVSDLWQVHFHGQPLWTIEPGDELWIERDMFERQHPDDRRVALSALLKLHLRAGKIPADAASLRPRIEGFPELIGDLEQFLVPPKSPSDDDQHFSKQQEKARRKTQRQRQEDEASWLSFARRLRDDQSSLTDAKQLAAWPGPVDLLELTRWLRYRLRGTDIHYPATQWRLLEDVFSSRVAEAYRTGMKTVWRVTVPERPQRSPGGGISTKHTTVLAFEGVVLETRENPDWHRLLTEAEFSRAIQHLCLSEGDCAG